MPKYTINGKTINSSTVLDEDALTELSQQLGATPTKHMVWQGNQLVDSVTGKPSASADLPENVTAAGGDTTNPFAYLDQSQKQEQGPAMQAVSQGVNRGVQIGAGLTKGAVINPAAAIMQVLSGKDEWGRKFAEEASKSYETQRANAGADGFDWAQLAGGVISPVNRLIPGAGPSGSLVSRGAIGGMTGAALNPVEGQNLSAEDVLAGKIEQMGLGALVGRVGSVVSGALVPTLKPGAVELIKEGVPVTPGQAYEGVPGWLFRQMESLNPFKNFDKVNTAFNTVVAKDVLSTIGEEIPNTVKPGQHAVAYVQKQISNFYDNALDGLGKNKFDLEYKEGVNKAINGVIADVANPSEKEFLQKTFANNLRVNIGNRMKDGEIDGKDIKAVQVWLKGEVEKYTGKTGVVKESLKQGYEDVLANLNKFISRVDTDGTVAKADAAWAKLYDFAQASKTATTKGGVFSPEQLAQASSTQAPTVLSAGGGKGPLNPLAQKGIDIIGKQDPMNVVKGLMLASKAATGSALAYASGPISIPILMAAGLSHTAATQLMKDPSAARKVISQSLQQNPGLFGQAIGNVYEQIKQEKQQ
jgi:hypothetical protein